MKELNEITALVKTGLQVGKTVAKKSGQGAAVAYSGDSGYDLGTDLYAGEKGTVRSLAHAAGEASGVVDVKAGEDAYNKSRKEGKGVLSSIGSAAKTSLTSPDTIQGMLYDVKAGKDTYDKARKEGGGVLSSAAKSVGSALTGPETVQRTLYDYARDKITNRQKEHVIHRMLNILEEKLEAYKEHLMLEANRNVIKQGRAKIIKARVRGGKIQRRKKLSAVKGYTIRGGKLIRMSPGEKRKRKMGARRAKFKRRAKLARALMKRKRSLRKRAAIGLK